jgi:hypothetical protein
MVLHSKQFQVGDLAIYWISCNLLLFQDAATRSIAALNRISMDFRFVIKTMMAGECYPWTIFITSVGAAVEKLTALKYKRTNGANCFPNLLAGLFVFEYNQFDTQLTSRML